jgi:hypothetical protein
MHNGIAVIEINVEEPAILEDLADRHPRVIYFEAEFETTQSTAGLDFREDLRALLNKYSVESKSATPDFILASFVENVLVDFEHATRARDKWLDLKVLP